MRRGSSDPISSVDGEPVDPAWAGERTDGGGLDAGALLRVGALLTATLYSRARPETVTVTAKEAWTASLGAAHRQRTTSPDKFLESATLVIHAGAHSD